MTTQVSKINSFESNEKTIIPGDYIWDVNLSSNMIRVINPDIDPNGNYVYDLRVSPESKYDIQAFNKWSTKYTIEIEGDMSRAKLSLKMIEEDEEQGKQVNRKYNNIGKWPVGNVQCKFLTIWNTTVPSADDFNLDGVDTSPERVMYSPRPLPDGYHPTDDAEDVDQPFLSTGTGGSTLSGGGESRLTVNERGVVDSSDGQPTTKTQEENKALFTTSTNFLDHYFIGLANSVSFIPMPHVPKLSKLIAIGSLVKTFTLDLPMLMYNIKNVKEE